MRLRLSAACMALALGTVPMPGPGPAAATLQTTVSGTVTSGYSTLDDGQGGFVRTDLAGTTFTLRYLFDTAATATNVNDPVEHYQRSDFLRYTVEVTLATGSFAFSETAPSPYNGYLSIGAGLSQGTFLYDYVIPYVFDDPRQGHFLLAETVTYSFVNPYVPSETFQQQFAYTLQSGDSAYTRFQYVHYSRNEAIEFDGIPIAIAFTDRAEVPLAIPEPASAALLLGAILMLGAAARARA